MINIQLPLLYLDPGTGSLLLYALIGVFATLFFSLRGLWYRLKSRLFLKKQGTLDASSLPELVFHSEGGKYWQVFEPVIRVLSEEGIGCAYITPDRNDPALSLSEQYPSMVAVRPGGEMATIAFMNRIHAKIVISTTPHLDIYMMKKSPHAGLYIYLFHAPTNIDFYEIFAFNHYDLFFTTGLYMENSLKEITAKRGLAGKQYRTVGCTYYDYMLREKKLLEEKKHEKSKNLPVVLYAPTWGDRSSITHYGNRILEILMEGEYQIIFRPHPQFYISHKELISEIEEVIAASDRVELDLNRTGMESMFRSDLLVTDFSGILFDFAFLFERPIILLEQALSLKGFEGEALVNHWDIEMSRKLAVSLKEEDILQLNNHVEKLIKAPVTKNLETARLRDREIINFGKAGKAAAGVIKELLLEKGGLE